MWRIKYYVGLLFYWLRILEKVELVHSFIPEQKPRKHCHWIRKIPEPFHRKVIIGYNIEDAMRIMRENNILPQDCVLLSRQGDTDWWRYRLEGVHHLRDKDVFGITLKTLENITKFNLRN